jgi:hypothetical protein
LKNIGNKIEYTGYSDTYHDIPDPKGWIGKDHKWLNHFFTDPFIPTLRNDFGFLKKDFNSYPKKYD